MKILVVAPMPPDPVAPGAIPVVLHAQVTGLARRHAVTVLALAGPEPVQLAAIDRVAGEAFELHVVTRPQPAGIQRWRRRWRLGGGWLRGRQPWRTVWFHDARLQEKLDELLSTREYDVVAVEDNAMAAYRYRTAAPVVLTEHEVRRPRPISWTRRDGESAARNALRELDWARWPGYEAACWRRFDRVHVFTRRDRDGALAVAPDVADRIRVVPFGIVLPPRLAEVDEDARTIVFVGNFTHPPNVDAAGWLVREIMPAISARDARARLKIVGTCPPGDLRSAASETIEVTGAVDDLDAVVQGACVVVAPVRIGGGMRMKVLHALATGAALVTTPRGLDGLTGAGEPVPALVAEDAAEFAGAVVALLGDAGRRKELGDRARAFALRHFSEAAYADRLESSYRELISSKSGESPHSRRSPSP